MQMKSRSKICCAVGCRLQLGAMAAAERSDEETEGSADEDFEEPSLELAASDEASEASDASEHSGSMHQSLVVQQGTIQSACHVHVTDDVDCNK